MASGTIYTYPDNYRAYKALIAAKYSGANVTVAQGFVFGETNKTEAFLKKFPLGKVPAFETSDGKCLTESNAIAYYVSNAQLRGQTDVEKAQIMQWMCYADNEIVPASSTWIFPLLGMMPFNKQTAERAKEDVKAALGLLNSHLLTRTFLVTERVSLADICMSCNLIMLYQYVLDPAFRKPFQNVNRWFLTLVNQPEFKAVVGDFKLCEKMTEYDAKKFAEMQGLTKGAASKEAAPSKKDKKKPEKKNEAKPAAGDAPEEMDETEMVLSLEPKSKDPLDALPKGTWNMDDFKRSYSNEDETKSIPYFWEKFDPENYSIWFCEYKYSDELKKVFMSCNLISGMYQRLDKMRKCAFASMCLFGTDNDNTISGVWVWRGHDLAFKLSPDWQIDYESYDWTKLDPSKDETKAIFKQYLSWTGTDKKGRKFNQGKVFK